MKKIEYQKLKEIILDEIDGDVELMRDNIKAHGKSISEWIRDGAFACYYYDAEATLRDVYGEDFKEEVYFTKDGDYRTKNGEYYIWTVYVWKMAVAVEKLLEEYGYEL